VSAKRISNPKDKVIIFIKTPQYEYMLYYYIPIYNPGTKQIAKEICDFYEFYVEKIFKNGISGDKMNINVDVFLTR